MVRYHNSERNSLSTIAIELIICFRELGLSVALVNVVFPELVYVFSVARKDKFF